MRFVILGKKGKESGGEVSDRGIFAEYAVNSSRDNENKL